MGRSGTLCWMVALVASLGAMSVAVGQSAPPPSPPQAAQTSTPQERLEELAKTLEELRMLAATMPTLASTVQELVLRVETLEKDLEAENRLRIGMPEALQTLDDLQAKVTALEAEVEFLRTSVADIEQPSMVSSSQAKHVSGMHWETDSGRYSMTLGGYIQGRYQLGVSESFDSVDMNTFRLRRARVGMKGHVGSERLRYKLQFELARASTPALDAYMDVVYLPELILRVGQAKVPYTRSLLESSVKRPFLEHTGTQDAQRYDRDVGVWVHGVSWNEKIHYQAGFSNGAGRGEVNDNLDLVSAIRMEGAIVGPYIRPGFGDLPRSATPRLTVGAAFVHDLVQLPETVAGVDVGERDVDNNDSVDNIRVLSSAVDLQFRYRGLDVFFEGTWRHERWGTILEHSANADLAKLVAPSRSGRRNYLGITGQVGYFVMPERLLLGARVSHGRMPFVGLNGRTLGAPLAERLFQADAMAQIYHYGQRSIGLVYSYLNFNAKDGPDPEGDVAHQLIIEAQIVL